MQQTKEKPSVASRVWTVIGIILCVILIPILVINCTLLIKAIPGTARVPTVGGIFPQDRPDGLHERYL